MKKKYMKILKLIFTLATVRFNPNYLTGRGRIVLSKGVHIFIQCSISQKRISNFGEKTAQSGAYCIHCCLDFGRNFVIR